MGKMEWEFPVTLKDAEGRTDRQRNRVEIPGSVCARSVDINLVCNMELQDGKQRLV